jgi:hypothetical protein
MNLTPENTHELIIQYLTPLEEQTKQIKEGAHPFLTTPYTVSMVGAGYRGGQPKYGVELAPKHLRDPARGDAENNIRNLGWDVIHLGDVDDDSSKWNKENDPDTASNKKSEKGRICHKTTSRFYSEQ